MIQPFSITETSPGVWEVLFPAAQTLDIYLHGQLIATAVTDGRAVVPYRGEPPVEAVLQGEEPPSLFATPWVQIQWRGIDGVDEYLVQRLSGAVWGTVARFPADGRGYYLWRSNLRPDGESAQYRVRTISSGVTGDGLAATWKIIRHPAKPAISVAVEIDEEEDAYYVFSAAPQPIGMTF